MRRGILATREELRALRDRLGRKAFRDIYQSLRRRCAMVLEAAPMTEQQWRYLAQQGQWGAALNAARAVQGRAIDLLIAHHIDPNAAYRDRAVEEVNNLVGWSAWVDPCHNHLPADLCTAEAAVAVAVALDWLWEDLSDPQRRGWLDALRDKAVRPYLEGVRGEAFWASCHHNWNAVVHGGVGLAGLSLSDESPDAAEAYKTARRQLRHFFDALQREGGWDEGTGYWANAMRYVLLLAEAARRLDDDQGLFHCRGMDETGLFPIYFTPNGRAASFGDSPAVPAHGTFYLLARQYGRREVTWWLDTYGFHHDPATTGWSTAGLAMLFRPPVRSPRTAELEPVKVFEGIGWAALADRWPRPSFYVAAKTGDLSANHSQHDMNSLQLQVDGEMLLVDIGTGPLTREYFSDARGKLYEVQARAHNTIVVAERDHQIDARGQIVAARRGAGFRYVACDADGACGENVRFCRHILMLLDGPGDAGQTLVVLDDLLNGVPEKIESFWHTEGQIRLQTGSPGGTITGRRASVHFALASTVKTATFVKTYPLNHHRRDNVVQVTAGVVGRALLASVFSRGQLPGELSVRERDDGGAEVAIGGCRLLFSPAGKHMDFAGTTGK